MPLLPRPSTFQRQARLCSHCAPGRFATRAGSVGCEQIPPKGTPVVALPTLCAAGRFALWHQGRIFCPSCLPGRYSAAGGKYGVYTRVAAVFTAAARNGLLLAPHSASRRAANVSNTSLVVLRQQLHLGQAIMQQQGHMHCEAACPSGTFAPSQDISSCMACPLLTHANAKWVASVAPVRYKLQSSS